MKVLTIKQPYATLIAEGYKEYEFRTWKTKYKEDIIIHAGLGVNKEAMKKVEYLNLKFPKSRALAIIKIDECIQLDPKKNKQIINSDKNVYGSGLDKGYAWKIKEVRKIDSNIEIKGKLGLWNYEGEL